MESYKLPLVFSGGFPKSLYDLNEAELERFLVYVWTYTNTAEHARVLPENNNPSNPSARAQSLRQLICALYERLGLSYLLYISEGLANTNGSNIYYKIDEKGNDIIVWDKKGQTEIVRIPASNVCYDAFPEKLENPKKKTRRKQMSRNKVWSQVPTIQIEIIDSDTEDSLNSGVREVSQDGIVISDSEEPENNKKEAFVRKSTETAQLNGKKRLNLKPNTDERVPFITSSVTVTQVYPVVQERVRKSTKKSQINGEKSLNLKSKTNERGPFITSSVSVTQFHPAGKPKTDERFPFITSSVSLTKVHPAVKENEGVNNVNGSHDPASVVYIEDDDEIIISDSEDIEDQNPPHRKVTDRIEEEILISDSEDAIDLENKSEFLYRLGLCEPTNLPDDPIILPVPGKGDFNKFHRLPLGMIPLLVRHSLIDKQAMVPGPPGQNSFFLSTNKRIVNDSIMKAKKTMQKNGRYKTVDLKNCVDYHYPKKHYRGTLSAPLAFKRPHQKVRSAKEPSQTKKRKKR